MKIKISLSKFRLIKFTIFAICLSSFFSIEAAHLLNKQTKQISENPDKLAAHNVITRFLQWYKANINKANSFPILMKDSGDFYMVNKKAVTDYLNFIKSSKFISPEYIAHWQTFFADKAIQLAKEKIQSDIPEGFDFDFVLITQEPELVLNQVSRLKFKTVSINKYVALVGVTLPSDKSVQYEFEMYKVKDEWLISYISTPNYD